MSWYWNPLAAVYAVPVLAGIAMSVLVFRSNPSAPQNRRLAALLYLENTGGACGSVLLYSTASAATAYALQTVAYANFIPFTVAYLLFLAVLPTRLARPLRPRWVQAGLVVFALAYVVLVVVRTELFIAGVAPTDYARYESISGPALMWAVLVGLGAWIYALAGAVGMWREAAPGTMRRRQGATYALAFGIRDTAWIVFLVVLVVLPPAATTPAIWLFPAANTLFYVVLAYGILHHQLFDIDLKIKFAISRGTVVALFSGIVFVASELVEQLLGVDQLLPAIVAAGVIALAMRPLARVGHWVADRAMPGVTDTEEYRTVRKTEVYRAALEEALADSVLTDKDRNVLAALADHLGISNKDAKRIETGITTVRGVDRS